MSKYVFPEEKTFIRPVDMRKRYGENYDPNIFKRWADEGRVEKLRNGLYLNKDFNLKGNLDYFIVARDLYEPSYVSMTSALRYYNFIPETVYEITSISTRKTKTFDNELGRFRYQSIKPSLFWGYKTVAWHGGYYNMATPEKALLDLAYLEPNFSDRGWLEEMRFDYDELLTTLDISLMAFYAKVMKSPVLKDRISLLFEIL